MTKLARTWARSRIPANKTVIYFLLIFDPLSSFSLTFDQHTLEFHIHRTDVTHDHAFIDNRATQVTLSS